MATYTLSASMQSNPNNLTMIGLADPLVANTKQLSAAPGGGTIQEKATKVLQAKTAQKRISAKTFIPVANESDYAGTTGQ
jgi:hypothetical protein